MFMVTAAIVPRGGYFPLKSVNYYAYVKDVRFVMIGVNYFKLANIFA